MIIFSKRFLQDAGASMSSGVRSANESVFTVFYAVAQLKPWIIGIATWHLDLCTILHSSTLISLLLEH